MTEITCPSGLVGEVRGFKVAQIDSLLNKARGGSVLQLGKLFEEVLRTSWVNTVDPGLYELGEDGNLDWLKVLAGDRVYVLLQIRKATYGSRYDFDTKCPSPYCRKKIPWTLDIDDLPVQLLSDGSKEAFCAGNRFETALLDGRRAVFKLPTGEDEERQAQEVRDDDIIKRGLVARVIEIEGIESGKIGPFIADMDMGDAVALLDAFDEVDCGVETTIEIQCTPCRGVWDVELPFDRGFFLPTRRRRRR